MRIFKKDVWLAFHHVLLTGRSAVKQSCFSNLQRGLCHWLRCAVFLPLLNTSSVLRASEPPYHIIGLFAVMRPTFYPYVIKLRIILVYQNISHAVLNRPEDDTKETSRVIKLRNTPFTILFCL